MLHIYAALAEQERRMISARTKAALSAAKARGVQLGNPRLADVRAPVIERLKAEADAHAKTVVPFIRKAEKAGASSLREIAEALNAKGVPTARGGRWHPQSVANVIGRS